MYGWLPLYERHVMTDRIVDRKNDRKKKSEVRKVTKKGLSTVFLKFSNKMYVNPVSSVVPSHPKCYSQ